MITGYNTDVRHGEVVFHVQTEDKGLGNPYIESLVYVGGQVLASKRASYAEMIAEGKDDKDIVALMDHQHRTMIAAIRHGKLDGKLAALNASRQTGQMPVIRPTGQMPVVPPRMDGPSTSRMPLVPAFTPPPAPPPAAPAPPSMPAIPVDSGETVSRGAVSSE